ncbi:MAG: type II toxin-antitoxin system HicA family toxin [Balneolales bacterium]
MGKKEKLLEKANSSATNFMFKELVKLAEHHGFVEVRRRGSHIMMKHDVHDVLMNFQDRKGQAKPYQVKQLLKTIEDFNL